MHKVLSLPGLGRSAPKKVSTMKKDYDYEIFSWAAGVCLIYEIGFYAIKSTPYEGNGAKNDDGSELA